jgi:hypothetical protein
MLPQGRVGRTAAGAREARRSSSRASGPVGEVGTSSSSKPSTRGSYRTLYILFWQIENAWWMPITTWSMKVTSLP